MVKGTRKSHEERKSILRYWDDLKKQGLTDAECAEKLNVGKSTLLSWKKRYEDEPTPPTKRPYRRQIQHQTIVAPTTPPNLLAAKKLLSAAIDLLGE